MKKAHFIGICGVGMSATARLLQISGWEISGSDEGFYPPVSDYLNLHKIPLTEGYRAENIPNDVDLIVIGKNAKLVAHENEEVKAALASGKTIRSFPEVLEGLTSETNNIVVAGSYGKSTCTALLSFCLEHAGKDPSYFIGAVPLNTGELVRLGEGPTFILEGDEYPSSNWDSTSKFLHYNPHDVLLTSAEHDHVNIFPTHTEYLLPFKTLLSLLPPEGLLIACADEESSLALAHTHPGPKVLYGLKHPEATWSAASIEYGRETTFTLTKSDLPIISLTTTLLGAHNIQNIVGVSAVLLEKGLLTPAELQAGISAFKGIRRRLDLKTENSVIPVYEGFGSSYQKARSAIEAVKLHYPERRLVVVFEPHTFSWRNRDTIHWYDDVFSGAGEVLIYEPAQQGATTHKQLSQEEIVDRVRESGTLVTGAHTAQDALRYLSEHLHESDVILILTSGDIGGLIASIPNLVELRFPKITHEVL